MTNKFAAAAAILMFGVSGAALAQSNPTATQTIRIDQIRASKLIGTDVFDRYNQSIGSIQDVILDKNGKVDQIVLKVGSTLGMGGKDVAVSFGDLKFDNSRLTLDKTVGQLQAMATYQLEDSNTGSGSSAVPVTGGHAVAPTTAGK